MDLKKTLNDHVLWLRTRFSLHVEGERANLRGANLYGANLYGANLRGANLYGANLYGADLYGANLRDANLRDANLYGANLRGANLRDANLYGANLYGADLYGAIGIPINCPESGSFIGYKKAIVNDGTIRSRVIVKLQITEDAKRSSATGRKCRCSEAKVLEIKSIDEETVFESAVSSHDPSFVYKTGETVRVDDFNENRFVECTSGIHFFITRQEAVDY